MGDLAHKHAGVGWGRKIGMDLALKRFLHLNKNGLIVGLDADTIVEENYLNSIFRFSLSPLALLTSKFTDSLDSLILFLLMKSLTINDKLL